MNATARNLILFVLVLTLISFRFLTQELGIQHFQPYTALFFMLAALRPSRWLLLPAVAYLASTIAISGLSLYLLSPVIAFALVACLGLQFKKRPGLLTLLFGSLGAALLFYIFTNSLSFITSPRYSKTLHGFIQATWSGIPSDQLPTWVFLRNSAVSTVLYSALIYCVGSLPRPAKLAEPATA